MTGNHETPVESQHAPGKGPTEARRTPSPDNTHQQSSANQTGVPGLISDEVIAELYRDLVRRTAEPVIARDAARVQRTLFDSQPPLATNEPAHIFTQAASRQTSSQANIQHSTPEAYQRTMYEQSRDREFEIMKTMLRDMTSKVHQATSSAPEIDRVLRETQNTPFSAEISSTPVRYSGKLKLAPYAGSSDPTQYLTAFNIAMGRTQFAPEEREAGYCQIFVENLVGSALTWFSRLETYSIHNFRQLSTAFLKHYSMFTQRGASNADLWAITQGRHETLRSYIDRFKAIVSRAAVTDDAALPALRNGLWFESAFKENMKLEWPRTLEDALHRASLYIEVEEERDAMTKKHTQRVPASKDKARENVEPR